MSDPLIDDPTNVLLGGPTAWAQCRNGGSCCGSQQYADLYCKRQYGTQYGYSNVFATRASQPDPLGPKLPTCTSGFVYQCRANTTQNCDRGADVYNRKGKFGTTLLETKLDMSTLPRNDSNVYLRYENTPAYWAALDGYCRGKYGKTAIRAFGNRENPYGQCVRVSWDKPQIYPDSGIEEDAILQWAPSGVIRAPITRPDGTMIPTAPSEDIEKCCNPKNPDPYANYACSPQTCFGKKACDNTKIVQSICSDKDNVANDPKCVDTCIRLNNTGSSSWCNPKIKAYCQGKNLETEVCRNYCSASNLDNNPDLAAFCENQYVNYCNPNNNDPTVDKKRQEKLCACVNSPLPNAQCVDAACTNGISVLTKRQRDTFKAGCPDICLQNFVVNGQVIDIDKLKWDQYCPGQPLPGTDPNNPNPPNPPEYLEPSRLATYISIPVIIVLVIIALVFLLLK